MDSWPLSFFSRLYHTHTHTRLTALCPGLPGWAGTRKVKPVWILLEQEIVSGSCISWAICKPAPQSRQITTPAPHHSVFYRPDALPAAQPTVSKHWRHTHVATLPCKTLMSENKRLTTNRSEWLAEDCSADVSITIVVCCRRWLRSWSIDSLHHLVAASVVKGWSVSRVKLWTN